MHLLNVMFITMEWTRRAGANEISLAILRPR